MHLTPTAYVLWFAAPVLQLGVLVLMFKRGLHRDYPYFFNYTVLQVISVPVLAIILQVQYNVYYYVYYVNLGLSVLISFAVLQEIFKDAFRPYEALRDLSVILFRWSALVVFLVGVMWAINAAHKPENGVTDSILLAERAVRLMQCGLVFFLLLFSEYLGIARRSLLFGISLGFGLFAAINMLVATGMGNNGLLKHSTLSKINSAAYLLSVGIWFGYTLIAAPSASKVPQPVTPRATDGNLALIEARVPGPAESLLDSMEMTVERLLYPPDDPHPRPSPGRG